MATFLYQKDKYLFYNNSLLQGDTCWPQQYNWGTDWDDIEKNAVAQFAANDIGRLARPEEIAGAVAYLTSPLAD